MLIYGFEFIHKFNLALLREKEKRFIENIKIEVKKLGNDASVDSLIIAGNRSISKIFGEIINLKIELLIKKVLKKPTYRNFVRIDY